jgi:hypothetical protein
LIIEKAIKQHSLKIYVISPETIKNFSDNLLEQGFSSIYDGIYGYCPYKLSEAFAETGTQVNRGIPAYEKFIKSYEQE